MHSRRVNPAPWTLPHWRGLNRGQKLYAVREHNKSRVRAGLPPVNADGHIMPAIQTGVVLPAHLKQSPPSEDSPDDEELDPGPSRIASPPKSSPCTSADMSYDGDGEPGGGPRRVSGILGGGTASQEAPQNVHVIEVDGSYRITLTIDIARR